MPTKITNQTNTQCSPINCAVQAVLGETLASPGEIDAYTECGCSSRVGGAFTLGSALTGLALFAGRLKEAPLKIGLTRDGRIEFDIMEPSLPPIDFTSIPSADIRVMISGYNISISRLAEMFKVRFDGARPVVLNDRGIPPEKRLADAMKFHDSVDSAVKFLNELAGSKEFAVPKRMIRAMRAFLVSKWLIASDRWLKAITNQELLDVRVVLAFHSLQRASELIQDAAKAVRQGKSQSGRELKGTIKLPARFEDFLAVDPFSMDMVNMSVIKFNIIQRMIQEGLIDRPADDRARRKKFERVYDVIEQVLRREVVNCSAGFLLAALDSEHELDFLVKDWQGKTTQKILTAAGYEVNLGSSEYIRAKMRRIVEELKPLVSKSTWPNQPKGEALKIAGLFHELAMIGAEVGQLEMILSHTGREIWYLMEAGEYDRALDLSEKLIISAEAAKQPRHEAVGLGLKGRIYLDKGEFDKAVGALDKAIGIFDAIGDKDTKQGEVLLRDWAASVIGRKQAVTGKSGMPMRPGKAEMPALPAAIGRERGREGVDGKGREGREEAKDGKGKGRKGPKGVL